MYPKKRVWSVYSIQPQRYGIQAHYKQGTNYSDVFDGIGHFSAPQHHTQADPSVTHKQTPC